MSERPNAWDLYSSHKDFARAEHAIEKAWRNAQKLSPDKPSSERAHLAEKFVYGELKRWSHVGAMDSEPIWVLKDRVRKHFGCDGGWL